MRDLNGDKEWVHAKYRNGTYCGDYANPAHKTKDMGRVDCPKCVAKLEIAVHQWGFGFKR